MAPGCCVAICMVPGCCVAICMVPGCCVAICMAPGCCVAICMAFGYSLKHIRQVHIWIGHRSKIAHSVCQYRYHSYKLQLKGHLL